MTFLVSNLKKIKVLHTLYLILNRSKSKYSFLLRRPILLFLKKILKFKIVTRHELINNTEQYHTIQFQSEELISCMKPYNLNEHGYSGIFIDEIPEKSRKDEFFLCEVDNAELAGPTALGFDKNRNIILETSVPVSTIFGTSLSQTSSLKEDLPIEECIPLQALASKFLSKGNPPQLDVACSLINGWSRNYYHWIVDCLARLESLELYQEKTGIKPTLIVESNPSAWQIESLKLLGYQSKDWIPWNGSRMKVNRLLVPSFRRSPALHVSPKACSWLRQRTLGNLPALETDKLNFSPYILISRRKAVGRRIINENEVIDALKPFGFVAYVLEDLSFADEVRLFSQAKIVVGPQGAGLTNMIFAENLTVIELFSSFFVDDTFVYLAKELGFRYGFLKCKPPSMDFRRRDTDIIVNVDALQTLVATAERYYENNRSLESFHIA
ncbi:MULTISPECIES: glycosyltransferase family 61 protein [Nostocales]|uniref:Glycosyltransferase 61 catalytic domain-containing protein n=4 Tax=Nostocales TaxID=1161 RepID=A0A0C1R683_9CYAN|nr:glycosyltransferase family 61 protein [Tolypothrix bouteillei]